MLGSDGRAVKRITKWYGIQSPDLARPNYRMSTGYPQIETVINNKNWCRDKWHGGPYAAACDLAARGLSHDRQTI